MRRALNYMKIFYELTVIFQFMKFTDRKIAGMLLSLGSVLCVLGIIASEALYPGYSTSKNYISDLGVGPSGLLFNTSVFLLGILALCGTYFIQKAFNSKLFSLLMAASAVGAMGVGLFTEDAATLHTVFSLTVFLFGGLSAIASVKLQKPPLSYLSVALGLTSLAALFLFAFGVDLGLGKGGMERLVAYPALLFAVSFGGYLVGNSKNP